MSRTFPPGPRDSTAVVEPPLVLAVDDDADARCIWAECLSHLGYQVASEPTGEDAIRAVQRRRPLAILMDLNMPGMGGLEAVRRIKADAGTHAPFVIVVTGLGPSAFADARAAGCDACFCKPFNAFTLERILRMLAVPALRVRSSTPTRRCDCGRSYTRDQWSTLNLWGVVHVPDSWEALEMRKCACGSDVVMRADRPLSFGPVFA